ncbi:MAG: hypothetical protein QM572_03000 [Nocardioides sp.]|uniref:hypothetical protein n=1 Tax=Nocardioides sp. TaxID=35761 RepID=UPI0039E37774
MSAGRRLLAHSTVSIVDQAWLSLLNMTVGLILIRETTQQEYGGYSQLFAAGLLAVTIAESVVSNPLTTLGSTLDRPERDAAVGNLAAFHLRVSTAVAVVVGAVVAPIVLGAEPSVVALAAGFSLYAFVTLRRELQRTIGFLDGRPVRVLAGDVLYGAALVGCVVGLSATGHLDLPVLMVVMALAGAVPVLLGNRLSALPRDPASYRARRAYAIRRGRLGLPGAVSSWLVNFSYLYVAAAMLGTAASAELNASRLLLVPISLSVVAWSRVARPMTGRLLADRDHRTLRRLMAASVAGLALVALVYAGLVLPLVPWLERHVLGSEYRDVDALVIWWAVYFAVYAIRWAGATALLSADAYPQLLTSALAGLAILVVALPAAVAMFGVRGAIIGLIVSEVLNLILVWGLFLPRVLWPRPTTTDDH